VTPASAPTLTDMREHAETALALRKPIPLDVELLARDVLILCARVEEFEAKQLSLLSEVEP
jgi:hypothetical protein